MADGKTLKLTYKGHPLCRKDNVIYYGSMTDKYIIYLQVLESKKVNGMDVASRVSVQLQYTDASLRMRDRIVRKSEKEDLYTAMDLGAVWLSRALSSNNQ